jgi:CDGSH-type Zn-finger protein
MRDNEPRVVRVVPSGPLMVEGPVRIEMPDGSVVESDRFMVAICTCRRSKSYPLCDTSHRCREPRRAVSQAAGVATSDPPASSPSRAWRAGPRPRRVP